MFKLGNVTYSVEELLAQIVRFGVDLASGTAEQQINSIVMTVPVYFSQAQRKAMLLVGEIAKVKILQILNGPTAIGINYGVFRAKDFNETAKNILFYVSPTSEDTHTHTHTHNCVVCGDTLAGINALPAHTGSGRP